MRYAVRQRFFSIGDSFSIKDEMGNDVYNVKRQILSFGKKLRIFDLAGSELCYIEQKLFRFLPEYDIYINGRYTANVKKKFSLLKNDFAITCEGYTFTVEGNFIGYDFSIVKKDTAVAYISKKFLALTDTYTVDINDNEDQMLILALAIVIDMVCHDSSNRN
jgi:uncharacterized protein YxjI